MAILGVAMMTSCSNTKTVSHYMYRAQDVTTNTIVPVYIPVEEDIYADQEEGIPDTVVINPQGFVEQSEDGAKTVLLDRIKLIDIELPRN